MPISQSPICGLVASVFGAIFTGYGINAMINPQSALSFFELSYPILKDQQRLVDALLIVYGARDIFMGVAIFAAAYGGGRRTLGSILIAAAACAGVDGWVCKEFAGKGEMNHWGYGPVVALLGLVLVTGL